MRIQYVISFFTFIAIGLQSWAQEAYQDNPIAFVEYLIDQDKTDDAKYVLSTTTISDEVALHHLLAKAYYMEGNLDSSIYHEAQSIDARSSSPLNNQFTLIDDGVIPKPSDPNAADYELLLLQHMAYLAKSGELDSFRVYMDGHRFEDDQLANIEFNLFLKAVSQSKYKEKKPWIGGALSTVAPGTGRLYAGRSREMLTSVLPILVMGAQAAEGFYYLGFASPHFYVFAPLALIYYGANIQGSINAVRRTNRGHKQELDDEIIDMLDPVVLQY